MFSSLRRIHWCVAFCAVSRLAPWQSVILDGPPSADTTSFSRHRSIAGYRPTIVLIAAGRSSVHSMRWSQILGQNPNVSLPHVHSTPPLGGGVLSEYCLTFDITFGTEKIRMVWLPEGEKNLKMCLFVLTESTNGQTDGQTNGQTPHDG